MSHKYLSRLIEEFFSSNVSEEVQLKFHRWFIEKELSDEKEKAMYDVWENYTNEKEDQTEKELKKVRSRIDSFEKRHVISPYKRLLRIAAIILLPLVGAVSTYYLMQDTVRTMEPEWMECFVPYGEQRYIHLSDGSEVWVNAGSLLIYAKEFTGDTRTLFLNGEANFNVAKNPDKPFIVKTEYMDIEALGTVFNVQSYPEAEYSTATLEHGKVRINTKYENDSSLVLLPNEQIVYNRKTNTLVKKYVDALKNRQWALGYLVFQSNTFNEIAKTIERRFGVTVKYETAKFSGRTFTIKFSPDENLNQIFDVLKALGGFTYKVDGNVIEIIH